MVSRYGELVEPLTTNYHNQQILKQQPTMITLVHLDDIIDDSVTQLVFQPKDDVLAFTLTNLGAVNFQFGDNITLAPGDNWVIGGSTLIPFVISKRCKFAETTGLKKVLIEKVVRVIIEDTKN